MLMSAINMVSERATDKNDVNTVEKWRLSDNNVLWCDLQNIVMQSN